MKGRRVRAVAFALLVAAALIAVDASAHGPTVKLAYGRVTPETLVIRVGDTVHFHNANASPGPITLVAEGFDAPVLAKGKGWHHTFEVAGVFPYSIQEFASSKGVIQVVPK